MKKIYLFLFTFLFSFSLTSCSGKSTSGERGKTAISKKITKISQGEIIINGSADDWTDIEPLTPDVGSKERGGSPPKIDLKAVKVTCDNDNLYILLEAAPVSGGRASIYVDYDGNKSTGVDVLLRGKKNEIIKLDAGWDYIIKLTYSSDSTGRAMLISQVEKFKKIKYGYHSELVFKHKDSVQHPSYVAIRGKYQELKIPLQVLNIRVPTDITFLFVEENGIIDEYEHFQFIKAAIK